MVFGSLVELHARLHSYLCFSLLEKLILKASSTPPRHLAIYQASKLFLIAISTLGGLIEKVPISSIASRQLGRSIELLCLIWWVVPQHLLDTFICQSLSRYICLFNSQTSLTHSNLFPQGFFKLFQEFLQLVSF